MKIRTTAVLGVALLSFAAAACGSDDEGKATATTAAAGTTVPAATAATTTETDSTGPDSTGPDTSEPVGAGPAAECGESMKGQTIKIGAIITAASYAGFDDGAKARVARANAEGGVCGAEVSYLDARDDGDDASRNQDLGRELIEGDGAAGVISASGKTLPATTDLFEKAQVPIVGWGFLPGFCDPANAYAFGWNGCLLSDTVDQTSLLSQAAIVAGGKGDDFSGLSFALLGTDDDAGRGGVEEAQRIVAALGGDVVADFVSIPRGGDFDATPAVQQLLEGSPDVIMLQSDFVGTLPLKGALVAAGSTAVIVDYTTYVPGLLESSKDVAAALEGSYIVSQVPTSDVESDWVEQINADGVSFLSLGASQGYIQMDLMLAALTAAGPGGDVGDLITNGFDYTFLDGGPGALSFPLNHTTPTGCAALVEVVSGTYVTKEPFGCFPNVPE